VLGTSATAVIRADNRKLSGDLAKTRAKFAKTFGRIGKGIAGKLGRALSPLNIGLGTAGVAAIGKSVLDFEDSLNRVSIQAEMSAEKTDELRQRMIELSGATGISRNELVQGVTALVNLQGTTGASADKLAVLSEASLATGESMENLAGLAFALGNSFKVTDAAGLEKGLSGIIQAGKVGAVPLGQMNVALQQLSAQFAEFGNNIGPEGAAELAAAMQVARRGFGSAEQAATGVQSMMVNLIKQAKTLKKKYKIDVFEDDGKTLKSLSQLAPLFAKLTLPQLTDALKRGEAVKGMKALVDNLKDAEDATGETVLGFYSIAEAAKGSNAVAEDAAKRRESSAFQMQKQLNRIKETIAEVFTPERIEKFVMVMEKLADAVGFVVDNFALFATGLAALKLASFIGQFAAIAGTAGTVATGVAGATAAVGGLTAALGTAAAAFGILGAAFLALPVAIKAGTWLGEKAGENTASNRGEKVEAFAIDRFKDIQKGRKRMQGASSLTQERLLNEYNRDSFGLYNRAQARGVIGETGEINEKAFRKTFMDPSGSRAMLSQQERDTLRQEIVAARDLVMEQRKWAAEGVTVKLEVDNLGNVVAKPAQFSSEYRGVSE